MISKDQLQNKPLVFVVFLSAFAFGSWTGCSHTEQQKVQQNAQPMASASLLEIKASQSLYRSLDRRKMSVNKTVDLGGVSDLVFDKASSGADVEIYYAITDRGPNGESKDFDGDGFKERKFPVAEFTPQILKIRVERKTGSATLVETLSIKNPKGRALSGLPNVDPRKAKTKAAEFFSVDEIPVNIDGKALGFDPWGLDPEGLLLDPSGGFWISEEYAPSILKLDRKGQVVQRWLPLSGGNLGQKNSMRAGLEALPAVLNHRKGNRGLEALSWTSKGTFLAFLQSELENTEKVSSKAKPSESESMVSTLILEFDPKAEKVIGLFAYPLHPLGGKIGAATLTADGKVAVLEHNSKTGADAWQKIFFIDLESAKNWLEQATKDGINFQFPAQNLMAVKKTLAADLSPAGLRVFEKLEGLTTNSKNEWVVANDNDFFSSLVAAGERKNSSSDDLSTKNYLAFLPIGQMDIVNSAEGSTK